MASEAPVYDLVLLLDTTIEQERRDTILANVEDAIDRNGELVGRHDWGNRHTVYEVRKHGEADYHLRVVCADKDGYNRFLEDFLFRLPGIAQVRTNLVLKDIKLETRLPV